MSSSSPPPSLHSVAVTAAAAAFAQPLPPINANKTGTTRTSLVRVSPSPSPVSARPATARPALHTPRHVTLRPSPRAPEPAPVTINRVESLTSAYSLPPPPVPLTALVSSIEYSRATRLSRTASISSEVRQRLRHRQLLKEKLRKKVEEKRKQAQIDRDTQFNAAIQRRGFDSLASALLSNYNEENSLEQQRAKMARVREKLERIGGTEMLVIDKHESSGEEEKHPLSHRSQRSAHSSLVRPATAAPAHHTTQERKTQDYNYNNNAGNNSGSGNTSAHHILCAYLSSPVCPLFHPATPTPTNAQLDELLAASKRMHKHNKNNNNASNEWSVFDCITLLEELASNGLRFFSCPTLLLVVRSLVAMKITNIMNIIQPSNGNGNNAPSQGNAVKLSGPGWLMNIHRDVSVSPVYDRQLLERQLIVFLSSHQCQFRFASSNNNDNNHNNDSDSSSATRLIRPLPIYFLPRGPADPLHAVDPASLIDINSLPLWAHLSVHYLAQFHVLSPYSLSIFQSLHRENIHFDHFYDLLLTMNIIKEISKTQSKLAMAALSSSSSASLSSTIPSSSASSIPTNPIASPTAAPLSVFHDFRHLSWFATAHSAALAANSWPGHSSASSSSVNVLSVGDSVSSGLMDEDRLWFNTQMALGPPANDEANAAAHDEDAAAARARPTTAAGARPTFRRSPIRPKTARPAASSPVASAGPTLSSTMGHSFGPSASPAESPRVVSSIEECRGLILDFLLDRSLCRIFPPQPFTTRPPPSSLASHSSDSSRDTVNVDNLSPQELVDYYITMMAQFSSDVYYSSNPSATVAHKPDYSHPIQYLIACNSHPTLSFPSFPAFVKHIQQSLSIIQSLRSRLPTGRPLSAAAFIEEATLKVLNLIDEMFQGFYFEAANIKGRPGPGPIPVGGDQVLYFLHLSINYATAHSLLNPGPINEPQLFSFIRHHFHSLNRFHYRFASFDEFLTITQQIFTHQAYTPLNIRAQFLKHMKIINLSKNANGNDGANNGQSQNNPVFSFDLASSIQRHTAALDDLMVLYRFNIMEIVQAVKLIVAHAVPEPAAVAASEAEPASRIDESGRSPTNDSSVPADPLSAVTLSSSPILLSLLTPSACFASLSSFPALLAHLTRLQRSFADSERTRWNFIVGAVEKKLQRIFTRNIIFMRIADEEEKKENEVSSSSSENEANSPIFFTDSSLTALIHHSASHFSSFLTLLDDFHLFGYQFSDAAQFMETAGRMNKYQNNNNGNNGNAVVNGNEDELRRRWKQRWTAQDKKENNSANTNAPNEANKDAEAAADPVASSNSSSVPLVYCLPAVQRRLLAILIDYSPYLFKTFQSINNPEAEHNKHEPSTASALSPSSSAAAVASGLGNCEALIRDEFLNNPLLFDRLYIDLYYHTGLATQTQPSSFSSSAPQSDSHSSGHDSSDPSSLLSHLDLVDSFPHAATIFPRLVAACQRMAARQVKTPWSSVQQFIDAVEQIEAQK